MTEACQDDYSVCAAKQDPDLDAETLVYLAQHALSHNCTTTSHVYSLSTARY